MASSARSDSLERIFKDFSQNIDLVSKQIKGGEVIKEDSDSFSPDQYWNAVDGILKKLSVETTKVSLAFAKTPRPSPQNTDAMVTEVEKAMLSLTSIFFTLPLSQGKVLRKAYQSCVVSVLERLYCFSQALMECVTSTGDSQRLKWTGSIWEATDFKLLKDNKECVLLELSSTEALVQDALGEIEEAKESDGLMESMILLGEEEEEGEEEEGGDGATWTLQDKTVIEACTGLVKAAKTVMKKCGQSTQRNGSASSKQEVAELDSLVALTGQMSARVDGFVCDIYAPVNYTDLRNNAVHLVDLVEEILNFLQASSLTDNSDESWLDFLHKALHHNIEKLRKSTLPDQGHG